MKPETAHLLQILRAAMRVLGFTNRDVEKTLGVSGGYLTRLFANTMELRFEHIVDIARAIGLEPEEVFQLAYPQPRNPPTEAAQRIRDSFPFLAPAAGMPVPVPAKPEPVGDDVAAAFEQQMERMMMKMFRKFFAEMMTKSAGGLGGD
jgi:hypothetical protein